MKTKLIKEKLDSMKKVSVLIVSVIMLVGVSMVGHSMAATNVFEFDVQFGMNGDNTPPAGSTPWLTATFDDSFGGDNTVRLTMTAPNLTGPESVGDWYFNFDPNLTLTAGTPETPGNLTFFEVLSDGVDMSNKKTGPYTGRDAFKADGDGWYDIKIDFPPPPGGGQNDPRFETGDTVIYDITYISPITVNSFNFFSTEGGGQGTYLSAAHIQQTGLSGGDSGWVGVVPEPVSSTLFIIGAVTLGIRGYNRRK